jgi:ATP-binding protein involved in chromosome partitioning
MYQKLNIPTLGLVENMSFYECTNCHHHADIFGHGGGEQVAQQLDIPFLGKLPLYQPIRVGSDRGIPLVIAEPDSDGTRAFLNLAESVMSQLAISAHKAVVANKGKIPLIQVK